MIAAAAVVLMSLCLFEPAWCAISLHLLYHQRLGLLLFVLTIQTGQVALPPYLQIVQERLRALPELIQTVVSLHLCRLPVILARLTMAVRLLNMFQLNGLLDDDFLQTLDVVLLLLQYVYLLSNLARYRSIQRRLSRLLRLLSRKLRLTQCHGRFLYSVFLYSILNALVFLFGCGVWREAVRRLLVWRF